jgi:hypothetical protein
MSALEVSEVCVRCGYTVGGVEAGNAVKWVECATCRAKLGGRVVSPRAEAPQQPRCPTCDLGPSFCRCVEEAQQEVREALVWTIRSIVLDPDDAEEVADAILSQFSVAPRKENQ